MQDGKLIHQPQQVEGISFCTSRSVSFGFFLQKFLFHIFLDYFVGSPHHSTLKKKRDKNPDNGSSRCVLIANWRANVLENVRSALSMTR